MLAKEAYTGPFFRACRTQLENDHSKWCILSGLYGFIWPTTYIKWYNEKLTPVTKDTCWDDCFGFITNRQYATLMTAERTVVLGSKLYADAAGILLQRPVESPLAGLPIGRMLQALKLKSCAPGSKPVTTFCQETLL